MRSPGTGYRVLCALCFGAMKRVIGLAVAFVVLGMLPLSMLNPARAGTGQDAGLWFMLLMDGPIAGQAVAPDRLRWWLDVQPRFVEDVAGPHKGLVRPGIGYALGKDVTAWLGYAWVRTVPESGRISNENRIW